MFGVCNKVLNAQNNYSLDEAVVTLLHVAYYTFLNSHAEVMTVTLVHSVITDNTKIFIFGGQNNNKNMLQFLSSAKITGQYSGDIELNFMIARHTKPSPDQ